MCQLILTNTGDSELNSLLTLVASSLGSQIHGDGWGIVTKQGGMVKSHLPACGTTNYGDILASLSEDNEPLMGHIRRASPAIPISTENAHPFVQDDVFFAHNGKLSPKEEKDFIMEIEEEEEKIDEKTQIVTKITRKIKRSDTLIFFEEFMKDGKIKTEKEFTSRLNATMKKFYGKFAFLVYMKNLENFYVVRGKTADLSIITFYTGRDMKKILGYMVDTSGEILVRASLLVSNILQLQGKKELYFSSPVEIEKEKIYRVGKKSLVTVAEIKENSAPVRSTVITPQSSSFYWRNTTPSISRENKMKKLTDQLIRDARSLCLSDRDIQILFFGIYGYSLLEVTEDVLEHFVNSVISVLFRKTNKKLRKRLRQTGLQHRFNSFYILEDDFIFPWMLNDIKTQEKYINRLEKEREETGKRLGVE